MTLMMRSTGRCLMTCEACLAQHGGCWSECDLLTSWGPREAIRVMRRQPGLGGRPAYHIFNLGFSDWGRRMSATACTHKATKSALRALTEALSSDLAKAGVVCSLWCSRLVYSRYLLRASVFPQSTCPMTALLTRYVHFCKKFFVLWCLHPDHAWLVAC